MWGIVVYLNLFQKLLLLLLWLAIKEKKKKRGCSVEFLFLLISRQVITLTTILQI